MSSSHRWTNFSVNLGLVPVPVSNHLQLGTRLVSNDPPVPNGAWAWNTVWNRSWDGGARLSPAGTLSTACVRGRHISLPPHFPHKTAKTHLKYCIVQDSFANEFDEARLCLPNHPWVKTALPTPFCVAKRSWWSFLQSPLVQNIPAVLPSS